MERETGFEPATPSLEGWRSTAELFPQMMIVRSAVSIARVRATRTSLRPPIEATRFPFRPATLLSVHALPLPMVGRGGFEPPKAYASRFTVCPLWPLGYLPESAGTR